MKWSYMWGTAKSNQYEPIPPLYRRKPVIVPYGGFSGSQPSESQDDEDSQYNGRIGSSSWKSFCFSSAFGLIIGLPCLLICVLIIFVCYYPLSHDISSISLHQFQGGLIVFSNLRDVQDIFPHWSAEILRLLDNLSIPANDILFAIDESGSEDSSQELLIEFKRNLQNRGVKTALILDKHLHLFPDEKKPRMTNATYFDVGNETQPDLQSRFGCLPPEKILDSDEFNDSRHTLKKAVSSIPFLRRMVHFVDFRNRVLRAGIELVTGHIEEEAISNDSRNTSVSHNLSNYTEPLLTHGNVSSPAKKWTGLFLNDIFFYAEDLVKLLMTNHGKYHAACGLDFDHKYYDVLVGRDVEGKTMDYIEPFVSDPRGRWLYSRRKPVPVHACWNGAIAFDVNRVIENKIIFRHADLSNGECPQSECLLFPADLAAAPNVRREAAAKGILDKPRVYINPEVRVGYSWFQYRWAHTGIYLTNWILNLTRWNKVSIPIYPASYGNSYVRADEELEAEKVAFMNKQEFDDTPFLEQNPPTIVDCPFFFPDIHAEASRIWQFPKLQGRNPMSCCSTGQPDEKCPYHISGFNWIQEIVQAYAEYKKCGGRPYSFMCRIF